MGVEGLGLAVAVRMVRHPAVGGDAQPTRLDRAKDVELALDAVGDEGVATAEDARWGGELGAGDQGVHDDADQREAGAAFEAFGLEARGGSGTRGR